MDVLSLVIKILKIMTVIANIGKHLCPKLCNDFDVIVNVRGLRANDGECQT